MTKALVDLPITHNVLVTDIRENIMVGQIFSYSIAINSGDLQMISKIPVCYFLNGSGKCRIRGYSIDDFLANNRVAITLEMEVVLL